MHFRKNIEFISTLLILLVSLSACSWSNSLEQPETRRLPHQPESVNTSDNLPRYLSAQERTLLSNVLERQLGAPYRYGGNTPNGFDCSGLVQYSFAQIGISLPRATVDQMQHLTTISRSHLRQGDLAFFQTGNKQYHVGIMLDSQQFIHAPSSGKTVKIDTLNSSYWRSAFIAAKRYQLN